jgi:hypothetical protein
MTACQFCAQPFNGRSNKLYCCTLCKKRAENRQNRLKRLVYQYQQSGAQEQKAITDNDWQTVRKSRARRTRLLDEIEQQTRDYFSWQSDQWLVTFYLRVGEILNRPTTRPSEIP